MKVNQVNPYLFEDVPSRKTFSGEYSKSSQYLTMRDKVKIAIEVVLPSDLSPNDKIPIVLMQTRYWRNYLLRLPFKIFFKDVPDKKLLYEYAAKRGYGIVNVDVRGTGASFGTRPYPWSKDEVEDGREIIDWIISQPWSNGEIVSMGGSYEGGTAEYVASLNHPAVKAVFPYSNQWDVYTEVAFPGGAFNHFFIRIWGKLGRVLDRNSSRDFLGVLPLLYFLVKGVQPVDSDKDNSMLEKAIEEHISNIYVFEHEGIVNYRDDPLTGQEVDCADNVSVFSKKESIEQSNVPFLTWAGWMDGIASDNIINRFLTYKNPMRAVIGDFDHGMRRKANPYQSKNYKVVPDKEKQMNSWFDFFDICTLRKSPFAEKVLYYYTMGEEKWNKSEIWPPKGHEIQRLYLSDNNSLSFSKPIQDSGEDTYKVDFEISSGKGNRWHVHYVQKLNYTNRNKIDKKLLCYTSFPLENDLEITGNPIINFYLTSTHEDGAIFAYLEDIDENNEITYITEGELRFIHRKISSETPPYKITVPYHSFKKKDSQPLVPGQIAEIKFGMWPISVLIKKGHRLRIVISGADKDTFSRYPVKGNPTITIKRDQKNSSYIDIPIIKRT
jgi:putative CocE/NonD family hydrolase